MSRTAFYNAAYSVPVYRDPLEPPWYHFLHGNVPGHAIDFMYRPEVPQGSLTPQHFSHLSRLMKYIEPHEGCSYAFTIGNLSRDDAQHEPGHGGLALIFGFRISGARDHEGRQEPPFAHAIAAVDRAFDSDALKTAALAFHEGLFGAGVDGGPSGAMYRTYVELGAQDEGGMRLKLLQSYTGKFTVLPAIAPSDRKYLWKACETAQPKRVLITCPENCSFALVAECAARIAAMLFVSNIRWTGISTGREPDVPGGLSVRFVGVRQLPAKLDEGTKKIAIEDIPKSEDELARQLFGAERVEANFVPSEVMGWRERFASKQAAYRKAGAELRVGGTGRQAKGTGTAKTAQAEPAQPIAPRRTSWPRWARLVLASAAISAILASAISYEMSRGDEASSVKPKEILSTAMTAEPAPTSRKAPETEAGISPETPLKTEATVSTSSASASTTPVMRSRTRPKAPGAAPPSTSHAPPGQSLFGGSLD